MDERARTAKADNRFLSIATLCVCDIPRSRCSVQPMDIWDAEGNAEYLYRLAGENPLEPTGGAVLARLLLGADSVRRAPIAREGALLHVDGAYRIYIRPGLSASQANFVTAHELAEWHFRHEKHEDIEHACDRLAAAICAPWMAFRHAVRAVGYDLPELAEGFHISESCAALRIGEVVGTPVALVSPKRVRVRGGAWGWPPPNTIRRLAKAAPAPLRSIAVRDQPRRAMVVAA
jgi:hypothetical protein